MRTRFVIVTACALVGWAAGGALGGCSGDDGATVAPPGDDGGGSSGTSGGSSGGTSGGTSGGSSGGGVGDAGPEGGSSSGGASNPGKISCGATECTVEDQICCRSTTDAGCLEDNDDCLGAEIQCDETADCQQGQKCCFGPGGGGLRARCRNDCGGGEARLCKTNTECGDGGSCTEKTCLGQRLRTCGAPGGLCN